MGGKANDQRRYAEGMKFPGIDPRQWISYATVDADTKDAKAIQFVDDDGNPSPYGPMISVTLQPSGVAVPCRVGHQVAGNGEGEWFPYSAGDEVLVAIPEGNERAGAVIIARLNQEIDAWPTVVAGQDPTKNTFGFRRMRVPYIVETAASYLIRSAKTGSQIGIDANGNLIMNDGDKGTLLIGPEVIGMAAGDEKAWVHVFPPTHEVYLGADTTSFLLSPSASKFISQGTLAISTSGGMANGSAVTAEQVVAFVINVVTQLAVVGAFNPLILPPPPSASLISPIIAAALIAMAGVVPTDAVPGGVFASPYFGAVFGPSGALAAAMSNLLASVDVTGQVPGFGRAGFKL